MKTLYWLIKREFWEHRGGFLWAPAITATVFLVIAVMSLVAGEVMGRHMGVFPLNDKIGELHAGSHIDAESLKQAGVIIDTFICASAAVILFVMAIVVFFYCLGSLYDDRKDRSILFWESLPIPNWKTVLSKVLSATLLAPIIATVLGVIFGLILLALMLCTTMLHGINAWSLLTAAHPIQVVLNIVALTPLYALCALPTIGWLMLCSAAVRSMPFLWALVIPLASNLMVWWLDVIGLLNLNAGWYLGHITGRLLFSVRPGNWLAFTHGGGADSLHPLTPLDVLGLLGNYSVLASPEVWLGIVAGVIMLVAAIWLRRWRHES